MPIQSILCRGASAALLLGVAGCATAGQQRHVPVYARDFPDPFVVADGSGFVAYSTNSAGINLPMVESRDLATWTSVRDPQKPNRPLDGMPTLAPWALEGRTWAPEILEAGNRWLLYYTAHDRKTDLQCVGVAVATDPRGPFVDRSERPMLCQTDIGGTIDASPFRDTNGQLYLYYKNDGNRVAKPTYVWGQALAADGLSLTGEPVRLLSNDQPWEAHVIEGATMVRPPSGGGYTLLYSANHYGWETHQRLSPYAMGYATCRGPLGPCIDAPENPILHSTNDRTNGCVSGPGHQSHFRTKGRDYIAFHAWATTPGCRKGADERYLYVAPLRWENGRPRVEPSLRPESR